ncbi:MAG: nicotinate-nucleotide--dimethylbenzimidazole phosphoribosyltransferase, partial [Gemmatimonadota bacterium]
APEVPTPHVPAPEIPAAVAALVRAIRPPNGASVPEIRARLDDLTKPRGSLGRLEDAACFLARILGCPPPRLEPRAVVVLAGDHGVTARGVSAYPSEVTTQMCRNIGDGGAAVSVLARRVGARLVIADLGVRAPVDHPAVLDRNVVRGTRDLADGPALTAAEVERAIVAGAALVATEAADARLLAIGEMGIGNTTAAAAVTAALLDLPADAVVGPGTGVDEAGLERKRRALRLALERLRPAAGAEAPGPLDVLREVGGAEIAGLVGVVLEGARRGVPVVLDGFISTAAALVAVRVAPQAASYLVASHRSAEPGHALQLDALWLEPLLDLGLRLGEGSGATLAIPLLDAAADILRDMATFSSAGVTTDAAPAEAST